MAQVKWNKPLYRGGEIRKGFASWQIPLDIRRAYDIRDKDHLDLKVQLGLDEISGCFRVSSGGELLVGTDIAEKIEKYAKDPRRKIISFSMESFLTTIVEPEHDKTISVTTRRALIAARIGQGLFRRRLIGLYEGRCAVTGNDVKDLLRASHIKPWCESNTSDRLSANNGLLLMANLDAAFDAKLISFADDGAILFRPELSSPTEVLGIRKGSKLRLQPTKQKKENLRYHRKSVSDKWGSEKWCSI